MLLLLLLAGAVPAAAHAPAPPPAAAAVARCPHCPDSLTVADGTPAIGLSGALSRINGHVVLDGCSGRVTLEDVLGESVEQLVGRNAWVNALCTGKGRIAAMGGHVLGDSTVDLFVMSMCPFGRALEKQMAADLMAGDSLKRPPVRVHWILYSFDAAEGQLLYSKHGEGELRETIVQQAIRDLEPARFWPYLAERSGSDTTWTAIAARVGLGWRTLTEIQRRLDKELQQRAHAEWLSMALDWPHIDGSPTIFWLGREVHDLAGVPGFGKAKMPQEQCKN